MSKKKTSLKFSNYFRFFLFSCFAYDELYHGKSEATEKAYFIFSFNCIVVIGSIACLHDRTEFSIYNIHK